MNLNSEVRFAIFVITGISLLVFLDHCTKVIAITNLQYAEEVRVYSILDLYLVYNKGGAFSFLAFSGGWQRYFFIFSGGLLILASLRVLFLSRSDSKLKQVALVLMVGGIAGNLVDRVLFGYVVDFLRLHWEGMSSPVFNFADIVILLAAMLSMIYLILDNKKIANSEH